MIIKTSTKETSRFPVHTRGFGLFGLLVFTRGAVAVPVRHALPKKYWCGHYDHRLVIIVIRLEIKSEVITDHSRSNGDKNLSNHPRC